MAEQWISADVAKRMAESDGQERSIEFIVEQASLGLIKGKATIARAAKNYDRFLSWDWEEREWTVPEWFWDNYSSLAEGERDWQLGRLSGICLSPHGPIWLELRGVQFSRGDVAERLRSAELPAPDSHSSRVGRRPKYDWPKAVIAVYGQIERGEFQPKVQADIEKALITQLSTPEDEPHESTVRPFAKLIWDESRKP